MKQKPKVITNLKVEGISCHNCKRRIEECPYCKDTNKKYILNEADDSELQIGKVFKELANLQELIIQSPIRSRKYQTKFDSILNVIQSYSKKNLEIEIKVETDINKNDGTNILVKRAYLKLTDGKGKNT